ncbi:carbohydrate ABC transporter permease [Meiothermus taiwanensis]|jgi:multiple sugar transport system permease protein|uniref:Trehalose transport system permease protein SugB n=2 Tax=Meiothermus taiwanensis TaxID=172827 RepID=A0A399DR36_9DEIN|nr:carbohydrate ABC transporter permease [Meiothermus taiwanensis]AWR87970.1 sugar ABC transporter permease [Meiothermus taiwanensis WR-220]KIQ53652.1 sugar ABC transporter permease [Meiothermus taiwanensis]KZK14685.1 sugar ABC transporter permease [Meiothermus taiwanensis]RIH74705.1 Trehalose transport system permease protein SugB [Meiothermus taiwanensis]
MNLRPLYMLLAIVLVLWVLIPIFLIATLAFSDRASVFAWPKGLLPQQFSLETISFFFGVEGVWKAIRNSLVVAAMTLVFSVLLGAPAGYALARYRFAGADAYRLLILMTRAFPLAILAIPLAVQFINLGIYDTAFGVALVHTALALPFAVLVTSSLFLGIPKELEEAAWTLGCNRIQAFLRVVLPLALPGLAATAIFAFVISWNEVFAATLLTLRERTLPAFLLTSLNDSPLPFRFAGGFFLIVPALVFIFIIRRYLFTLWGIANR